MHNTDRKGEPHKQAIRYTYPQLPNQKVAVRPGSKLNRQGGSEFNRREQITSPATLAKSLRALVAAGLVAVTRKGGCTKGGQRLPTLYRLTDHQAYENPTKYIEAHKATNDWKSIKSVAMGEALIRQAEVKAKDVAQKKSCRKKISLVQKLNATSSINEAVMPKTTSKIEAWNPSPSSNIEVGEMCGKLSKPNTGASFQNLRSGSELEIHTSKNEVLSTCCHPYRSDSTLIGRMLHRRLAVSPNHINRSKSHLLERNIHVPT